MQHTGRWTFVHKCLFRRCSGYGLRLSLTLHGANEPIAASRQRLDVFRIVGRIAQRLAKSIDRRIERLLRVDETLLRPQSPAEGFARDELAGLLQQRREDEERLIGQADGTPISAQLLRAQVGFELIEANSRSVRIRRWHVRNDTKWRWRYTLSR